MNKQIEAMKLALEALKNTTPTGFSMERDKQFFAAITALREALAEQPAQQDPLIPFRHGCKWCGKTDGCEHQNPKSGCVNHDCDKCKAQQEPLTQTQVVEGFCKQPHNVQFVSVFSAGVRFAEAAHGITSGEATKKGNT